MRGFEEFWAFVLLGFLLLLAHALQDFNGISTAVLQSLLLDLNPFFSGLPYILMIFWGIVVLCLKLDRPLIGLHRNPHWTQTLPFLLTLPADLLAHL